MEILPLTTSPSSMGRLLESLILIPCIPDPKYGISLTRIIAGYLIQILQILMAVFFGRTDKEGEIIFRYLRVEIE